MTNQGNFDDSANASSIDYEKQLRLDEEITQKDIKRHQNFFESLSEKGKIQKVFASFAIVAILGFTGLIAFQAQKDQDIKDSSAYDCSDFQMKVYDANGYTCADCPLGEFGKLSLCEKESPTGVCEQTSSGCFVPDL